MRHTQHAISSYSHGFDINYLYIVPLSHVLAKAKKNKWERGKNSSKSKFWLKKKQGSFCHHSTGPTEYHTSYDQRTIRHPQWTSILGKTHNFSFLSHVSNIAALLSQWIWLLGILGRLKGWGCFLEVTSTHLNWEASSKQGWAELEKQIGLRRKRHLSRSREMLWTDILKVWLPI